MLALSLHVQCLHRVLNLELCFDDVAVIYRLVAELAFIDPPLFTFKRVITHMQLLKRRMCNWLV